MRQCQEMVSELTGVYKEHNFVHEIDRYQKQTLLSISFLFFLGVVCELAGKRSENMRVKAEVEAGKARMEKV